MGKHALTENYGRDKPSLSPSLSLSPGPPLAPSSLTLLDPPAIHKESELSGGQSSLDNGGEPIMIYLLRITGASPLIQSAQAESGTLTRLDLSSPYFLILLALSRSLLSPSSLALLPRSPLSPLTLQRWLLRFHVYTRILSYWTGEVKIMLIHSSSQPFSSLPIALTTTTATSAETRNYNQYHFFDTPTTKMEPS
jgi:hypothetical protein